MSAERQRADVPEDPSAGCKSASVNGRFRIYDVEDTDTYVEADLDAVLPVGAPDDSQN